MLISSYIILNHVHKKTICNIYCSHLNQNTFLQNSHKTDYLLGCTFLISKGDILADLLNKNNKPYKIKMYYFNFKNLDI